MGSSVEAEILKAFLALGRSGKAVVMASIAHRETVRGREAYLQWDGPIDGQLLRETNEYLHRLTGYIAAVLDGRATPDYDASFMQMVIEVMMQRGEPELDRLAASCGVRLKAARHSS